MAACAALSVAALITTVGTSGAAAAEHIKIGVLKATNEGPVFIALDKGFFAKEGLDAELVTFESAQPIAVAAASGAIDFGATSTSAGLYSLAGQGAVKVIAGLYSEHPGFHNFAVAASLRAANGGLKTYQDLVGHSVAVTQVGSPTHYSLALIAEKYHLDLDKIRVLPLQSIPNMASALKGNQADASVINATTINPLLEAGEAKLIGWVGDATPWQAALVFAPTKLIAAHRAMVEAFLRAFKHGTKAYYDAYTGADGTRKDGPTAPEMTAILAKYTSLKPAQVEASIAYVDGAARVDVADVLHQVEWFKSQKMLKNDIDDNSVIDHSLVVPLPAR